MYVERRPTMPARWPEEIRQFLDSVDWTFAATYARTWPHHYIVKDRVEGVMFTKAVRFIRQHGSLKRFYHRRFTYFEQNGVVYWTMVPPDGDPGWYPAGEETIINKCTSRVEFRSSAVGVTGSGLVAGYYREFVIACLWAMIQGDRRPAGSVGAGLPGEMLLTGLRRRTGDLFRGVRRRIVRGVLG